MREMTPIEKIKCPLCDCELEISFPKDIEIKDFMKEIAKQNIKMELGEHIYNNHSTK